MATTHRVTRAMLQAYYGLVKDLPTYISELLGSEGNISIHELLFRQSDPASFKIFLTQALVALPELTCSVDKTRLVVAEPMVRMSEVRGDVLCALYLIGRLKPGQVIDRALEKLVPKRVRNVLTEGYKQVRNPR